jgi:hypothetical protein
MHTRTSACVKAYSEKYDRYLCKTCKVWLDACTCGPEDGCPFPGAPDSPDDEIMAAAEDAKWNRRDE